MTCDWTKDTERRLVLTASLYPGPNARAGSMAVKGEAFDGLVASVKEKGVLVPLIVRPLRTPTGKQRKKLGVPAFQVVAGHRRLEAALTVGLEEVQVTIADLTDAEAAEVAAVENLQREDLTSLEEAEAYRQLRDDAGLNPKDIAARTGLQVARVNGVLRLLELPEELRAQVGDDFPLAEVKWILKVPVAAVSGRARVFDAIARGSDGKWAFFDLAGILDPEKIAFDLTAKPNCLDCPKQRRYQVPPTDGERWNWRGETGKGWPEIPVCFDSDCRNRKATRGRGKGRKAALRALPGLVTAELAKLMEAYEASRLVNTYEALKKWRKNRQDRFHAQAWDPQWAFDEGKVPDDHAWALNGPLEKCPADEDLEDLRKACADCPHSRISVDGYVDHHDRARVLVRLACMDPALREKELAEIRQKKHAKADQDAGRARRRLWTRDLPKLKKEDGANVIADALVRRLDSFGVRAGGPVADALLGSDPKTSKLLDSSGSVSDEDRATMREALEKTARALYAKDPRKLVLLFALPYLADHVYSLDGLATIVRRRLEVVGLEVDHHRLEAVEKGTLASVKDAIAAASADECRILVGRLTGQHGQKSKVVALERRLGKLNKEKPVD